VTRGTHCVRFQISDLLNAEPRASPSKERGGDKESLSDLKFQISNSPPATLERLDESSGGRVLETNQAVENSTSERS